VEVVKHVMGLIITYTNKIIGQSIYLCLGGPNSRIIRPGSEFGLGPTTVLFNC
jgi:hypothetical protein